MSRKLSMANTRMKLLAGAVILGMAAVASAASAQTLPLVGGGATLPAGGYVGFGFQNNSNPLLSGPGSIDTGSLFGVYTASSGNTVQYCQTGSGAGKRVLSGTPGEPASNPCDASATTGFGAPAGKVVPDFAGSDAPMSAAEYATYVANNGATFGEPVQFPSIAGSVAIAFHKSGVTSLNLTDTQICGIYAGTITDWSQISSASGPITVVFRSDGSGTSFSFSNHLAAVCGTIPGAAGNSGHFVTDQAFATVESSLNPTLPSSFVGASGNPAVVSAVASTDGAIGYAETANALHPGAAGTVNLATVNGLDPVNNLPNSIALAALGNEVISGTDSNGVPTLASITPGVSGTTCQFIVNPTSYANGVGGSYPILAVTNLLGNYQGNGGNTSAIQGLLSTPYTSHTGVTTIGSGTGYAFLTVRGISATTVSGCIHS